MTAKPQGALARVAHSLAAISIAATALPLNSTGKGWVRIWDFPRLQIAVLGAAAYAAMLRWGGYSPLDYAARVALAASVLYQASRMYPYTRLHRKQVLDAGSHAAERRIRLVEANVYMENRRAGEMRQAILRADPDVICLLEPDSWWETQMRPLERLYPYTSKCPLDNTYGMLVYSRLPFVSAETRFLVRDDIPSMRLVVRLRSGDEVLLHCLHPRPPRPNTPTYGRDAELVIVGEEVRRDPRPTIVMGDLNDVAWSYTTRLFQKSSQTLDPRVGRGLYNTFHARHPLLRFPLDHFFHTREFTLARLERLPNAGSDHFPMSIELVYEPDAGHRQEPPQLTQEDREEQQEKLDDVHEHRSEEMSAPG